MHILRFCISRRVTFLAGAMAPDVFMPIAIEWDAAVHKCLTRMFKGAAPHPRCFLRGEGGLDIHVVAEELSLLRVLSCGRAVDCIRKYMPRLAPLTVPSEPPSHPVHIEIQAAWEALPVVVRAADGVLHPLAPAPQPLPPPPPTVPAPPTASPPSTPVKATVAARRALTAAFAADARKALFLRLDDVDRVLLEASCGVGARAWADVTPTYDFYQMDSTQSRLSHCWWMGGEVAELAGSSDPRGRDLVRSNNAGHTNRHTVMVNAIGDVLKDAGQAVWKEVTGLFPAWCADVSAAARNGVVHGELRRMDLVSTSHDLDGRLIDPTVVDPATPEEVERAATSAVARPTRVVDDAEAAKVAHYPDVPPGFTLSPVGFTTQATCGALGKRFLTDLGRMLACRRNGTATPHPRHLAAATREVRARVGVALMRELADQIAGSIAGSPHAALAGATRYVHTAWRAGARQPAGMTGADGQPDFVATRVPGESGGRLLQRDCAGAGAGSTARRRMR
jgi:hypothetical protein